MSDSVGNLVLQGVSVGVRIRSFQIDPDPVDVGVPITSWQKFLAGDRFIEPSSLAKFKKELEA